VFEATRSTHRYCTATCCAKASLARRDPAKRRAQARAASQRWRERHPEEVRAQWRQWKSANPEKAKANRKGWKIRNRERTVEHERSRQQRRPEVIRAQKRKLVYGITAAVYEAKFQAQGRVCAICGTDKPTKKGWAVDHCHTTGAFRGVLCGRCNPGLGLFGDDVNRLHAAIDYLLKSRERVA
jgi:hypothetical protein